MSCAPIILMWQLIKCLIKQCFIVAKTGCRSLVMDECVSIFVTSLYLCNNYTIKCAFGINFEMVLISIIYSSAIKVIVVWFKYKKLNYFLLCLQEYVYLLSKSVYTLMILLIFIDSLILWLDDYICDEKRILKKTGLLNTA